MLKDPTQKRIRLTISVSPAVHSTFHRLAAASGSSVSWAMGEWLADTLEASTHMTRIVEEAKSRPVEAINHLQGMLASAQGEADALLATMATRETPAARVAGDGRDGTARSAGRGRAAAAIPPSSNTGGKGTHKGGGKAR